MTNHGIPTPLLFIARDIMDAGYKDPDDFPVSQEADRDIFCLDCGTAMTWNEQEMDSMQNYCCCNCGSTELDERPLRAALLDIARGL